MTISPKRRQEIIDALRRGTVPRNSLDAFAVGLDRFEATLDEELRKVASGGSVFKAVRGEYGCGKTFFARWLADRARKLGFASAEVQVSETETPLHRLETVYRRLMERLATADTSQGAWRNIVDGWFHALEEDVLAEGRVGANDQQALVARTNELLEQRISPGKSISLSTDRASTVFPDPDSPTSPCISPRWRGDRGHRVLLARHRYEAGIQHEGERPTGVARRSTGRVAWSLPYYPSAVCSVLGALDGGLEAVQISA